MCLDGSSVKLEEVEEIPKETEGIVDIVVNNPDVAEVTLNENGCEIIGKTIGNTDVKFKCRDVETNVNIDVNEKSVYENVDIGQYVDIGVYYDTPSAVTFTSDRTVTDKPLTGWRVLSKDGDKQTVKLISAGCPIAEDMNEYALDLSSINDDYNYTNKYYFYDDCFGLKGCDFKSCSIGDFLQETCKFYDPDEGVHGFGFLNARDMGEINDKDWCEDDLGEFLRFFGFKRVIRPIFYDEYKS